MSTALRAVPISQDRSDAELVAAVRSGSDAAFAELYSRYSHRIGTHVRSMVGDHGRAEDITQEIFIAALRRMRETERPIAFKAWIYEIAKNACIDNFRRSHRAQEVSLDADVGLSSADRVRLTAVTTLDTAFDTKQALHDLRGAFGGLSDSHHEILVLRELEGRSYHDIGERLGMSRPVVESTLFRARRRLAEEYEELTSGRRCEFVRRMVDSGPQYSLGIRDRRRMARHFAHCQACRSHARLAGFDQSILNMPNVAAKIAALSPIGLLRARWGALGHGVVGGHRGRPSLLAFRSIQSLARSSDQIVGVSAGAGRAGTAAAALVLASVGGIATVASYQPKPSHARAQHAIYGPVGHSLPGTVARREPIVTPERPASSTSATRVLASQRHTGATAPKAPVDVAAGRTQTASSGTSGSSTATRGGASAGAGTVDTGAPNSAGAGGTHRLPSAGSATTGAAATPAGAGGAAGTGTGAPSGTGGTGNPLGLGGSPGTKPQLPVLGALSTGALPTGTISNTVGAVTGAVPGLQALAGALGRQGG